LAWSHTETVYPQTFTDFNINVVSA